MISLKDDDIKQFESDLKTFAAKAYPFATRSTLNRAAYSGQKIARDIVSGKMVQRNVFTRKSIQVEEARSLNVRHQEALLGSIADYMEKQEFGTTYQAKGQEGRPIATPQASGESSLPRKKLPQRANKFSNIQLSKRRITAANRRQRNRIAVQEAASRGGRNRYVFLDLGRRKGIYKILGGKRSPRIKRIWDMSHRAVRVPARPWLGPATEKATREMPRYYRDALIFQLKRRGIFNG